MLIDTLRLKNFLSFGPKAPPLTLGSLNVLIGPNGSGKSNLLEALSLLKAAPLDVAQAFREGGGGVRDWLWKSTSQSGDGFTELETDVRYLKSKGLRYLITFTEASQRFELIEERVDASPNSKLRKPARTYYHLADSKAGMIAVSGLDAGLTHTRVEPNQSVLAQRRDPDLYPEISYLAQAFSRIRIYRNWNFGRSTPARRPQDASLPNDHLLEDCSNLGLVLSRLRRDPLVKARLLAALRMLYEGIDDYEVVVEGGTVQVFFQEGSRSIPATRLSDGTLRYLCLLAVLCHPEPPPLVAIEEPELGLHPDILPALAELLRDAAERTQLIVTTHSEVLVDGFSDTPDVVVVVERGEDGTTARRLDQAALEPWLTNYRLGRLWSRGDLGGNRW